MKEWNWRSEAGGEFGFGPYRTYTIHILHKPRIVFCQFIIDATWYKTNVGLYGGNIDFIKFYNFNLKIL
jgi:hypothetical protein